MSLINRIFLAWCAEPSRSDATYIYAYPLYEIHNDSYVPVDESIPESILIHLRDGGTSLYGADFLDNGHVFQIHSTKSPDGRTEDLFPPSTKIIIHEGLIHG